MSLVYAENTPSLWVLRVEAVSVCFQCRFHHADAAFGEDAAFERRVGLESYDYFVFLVDVARAVCREGLRELGLRVINALLALGLEHFGKFVPQSLGLGSGALEKTFVAVIRRVVVLYEVADVDFALPHIAIETFDTVSEFHKVVFLFDKHLFFYAAKVVEVFEICNSKICVFLYAFQAKRFYYLLHKIFRPVLHTPKAVVKVALPRRVVPIAAPAFCAVVDVG